MTNGYEESFIENYSTLRVKKIYEGAVIPTRSGRYSSGYSLNSCVDCNIKSGSSTIIPTGLIIAIPFGHCGRIVARNELAVEWGIDVGSVVIDCDCRSHVKILLFNFGLRNLEIKAGEPIAQLIVEKISTPIVEVIDDFPETICRNRR